MPCLVFSLALALTLAAVPAQAVSFTVDPTTAGTPVLDAFVSFSIELSSFPEFAGNASAPNRFTAALLSNFGSLGAGSPPSPSAPLPYVRVGGNTQDYALYDARLPTALVGTYNATRSPDYPTTIRIGPAFFEGYGALPRDVRAAHGFNLALGPTAAGRQTLRDTVPLVCRALADRVASDGRTPRLYAWEYGNEPDLYATSAQGPVRPAAAWDEAAFVAQWRNGTHFIRALAAVHCPQRAAATDDDAAATDDDADDADDAAGPLDYAGFLAPSFAGTQNQLRAPAAWAAGLDDDGAVSLFSTHNGAASPGVTLQGTLLNHTRTRQTVDAHVAEYAAVLQAARARRSAPVPRLVLGEANSLYNQGKPGLSNAFGAALWTVDFLLYSAAAGIARVHLHQGSNYRYAAWQPVATANTTRGTKAPYYGALAAAAALGDTRRHRVAVADLAATATATPSSPVDAAYAVYADGRLVRVLALNLRSYNTTLDGSGLGRAAPADLRPRGHQTYTFALPSNASSGPVRVQRLMANGSDAISGITWDGHSYNVELAGGQPVRLANATVGEHLSLQNGAVTVTVPDASAVLLHL